MHRVHCQFFSFVMESSWSMQQEYWASPNILDQFDWICFCQARMVSTACYSWCKILALGTCNFKPVQILLINWIADFSSSTHGAQSVCSRRIEVYACPKIVARGHWNFKLAQIFWSIELQIVLSGMHSVYYLFICDGKFLLKAFGILTCPNLLNQLDCKLFVRHTRSQGADGILTLFK